MRDLGFLTHPTTAYVAAAVGLAACVALVVFLQLEVGTAARRASERDRTTGAALDELRGAVALLEAELAEMERRNALLMAAHRPRASLNLSTRTQALRMHRRGDGAERISASLQIPRGEVDRLWKVHRIVIQNL